MLDAARDDQAALAAVLAAIASIKDKRKQKLAAERAQDRRLDAAFSAIRLRLGVEIKGGSADSSALDAFLFPRGTTPLTKPRGRPQLAVYQAWLLLAAEPVAAESSAYAVIAGQVEDFRADVARFAATIKEKESLGVALTDACAARKQAREAWDGTFRELIDTAARAHGKRSDAFRSWIRTLRVLRANNAGARARAKRGSADAHER